jgi:hypothetical protein
MPCLLVCQSKELGIIARFIDVNRFSAALIQLALLALKIERLCRLDRFVISVKLGINSAFKIKLA